MPVAIKTYEPTSRKSMNYAQYIREIARGPNGTNDLSHEESLFLYGAILDGGIPDFELGAIVTALRLKGETIEEMQGFNEASHNRVHALNLPKGHFRPVVLPSYNGARKSANLTPLLALLLRQFSIPVVIHGLLEGFGRVTTAQIFRELGVLPVVNLTQAQTMLDTSGLVFVPLSALSQGLASQLALRARTGLRNCAHSLVKMLDPFKGRGLVVMAATHPEYLSTMRQVAAYSGQHALLLRATEGEPFANPKRRPDIEYLHDGQQELLFEAEHDSIKSLPGLPEEPDAKVTADWIRRVLDGTIPIPHPISNQLAACLYATGYAQTLSEAKAILAVKGKISA
jgi:anthranilate phosphoribosyltransferase